MADLDPVPQEILERLARLEAQVAWLSSRVGAAAAPPPQAGPGSPAAPPPPVRPVPVPPRPVPLTVPVDPESLAEAKSPVVWVAVAGSVLFLVGAIYFLHWSIQRGWLGPELRFLMGLLTGLFLAGSAARLMLQERPRLGVALLLAGLGTLVFTLRWGAFTYHFFPPVLGLGATSACVLLAGGLGARVRSGGALAVALGTGLLAPLVFSTGGNHEVALAVYLAVLQGAALAVPYLGGVGARWHFSRWMAWGGIWLLLAICCAEVIPDDRTVLGMLLLLHFVLSGVWIWLPGQPERPGTAAVLWTLACGTFTGLLAAYWRWELRWTPELFALPVLGMAALNLALVPFARRRLEGRAADLPLLALAFGHLALAVPVALAWRWVGPFWGVFALALAWACERMAGHPEWEDIDLKSLRLIAAGMAVAATLRWMVHGIEVWAWGGASPTPFFNSRFAEGTLAAAAWLLLLRAGLWEGLTAFLLEAVGGLTLSLELAHLVYRMSDGRSAAITLTLVWAALGALQWLAGLRAEAGRRGLTAAGYTWLALASLKLVFVDLSHADTPLRALAFLGVGGIFLGAALVGNRVRRSA